MTAPETNSNAHEDQQIEMFLQIHIPEGTEVYAPEGADEVQCGAAVAEHFQALAAEETLLLDQMADVRFVG